eukprot:Opistho-2@57315
MERRFLLALLYNLTQLKCMCLSIRRSFLPQIARTLPKMPELDEFMRKMGEDEIPAAETEQEAASTESPAEASIAAATHSEAEDDGQESDGDTDAGRESATSSSRANGGHASPRSTATDDDSDVFCDPLDLPPASHGQFVTSTEHGSGSVGDDGRGVFSSSTSNGGHGIAAASHPSGGHVVTKAAAASASVDEVRKIMLRTQQDLERTVSRVAALEAAVEELRKRPAAGASPTAKQTLPADEFEWPLAGVSRNSKIFLVLWPVVVHLIFRLLSRRSRR